MKPSALIFICAPSWTPWLVRFIRMDWAVCAEVDVQGHAPAEPHSDYHLKHYSAVTYKARACSCLIVVAMVSGNRFGEGVKLAEGQAFANDRCPRRRGRAGDPRWTALSSILYFDCVLGGLIY